MMIVVQRSIQWNSEHDDGAVSKRRSNEKEKEQNDKWNGHETQNVKNRGGVESTEST